MMGPQEPPDRTLRISVPEDADGMDRADVVDAIAERNPARAIRFQLNDEVWPPNTRKPSGYRDATTFDVDDLAAVWAALHNRTEWESDDPVARHVDQPSDCGFQKPEEYADDPTMPPETEREDFEDWNRWAQINALANQNTQEAIRRSIDDRVSEIEPEDRDGAWHEMNKRDMAAILVALDVLGRRERGVYVE